MDRRTLTAVICVPLFLLLLILGGWWFAVPVLLLTAVACWEYSRLLTAIRPQRRLTWILIGAAYIVLGFLSLLGLRLAFASFLVALWLLLDIWLTDTAAYLCGRRFGRRPLAPTISPHKTQEGALAGLIAGGLIAAVFFSIAFHVNFFLALLLSLLISVIGQIGDLLESKVKRMAGVKDSGNVFPGHGGVLDRFDSIMLAAPFAYIFALLAL